MNICRISIEMKAIITSSTPAFMVIFARLLLKERLTGSPDDLVRVLVFGHGFSGRGGWGHSLYAMTPSAIC